MYSKDEILKYLTRDKIKNINMINFINTYHINNIDMVGNSILVRGKSDQNWVYISSSSKDEFIKLVDKLTEEDIYFAIIEDWMLPYLIKDKKLLWKMTCMKLIFPENLALPENKYNIKELTVNDAEYIYNHYEYKDYASAEYIAERIIYGTSLGIYEDNKLVAWIMVHDDGAVGFLNVLHDYRRKGYGYELTIAMIKKLRELGEIPFVHIEEDNIKSMNLALKLGFKKDRRIHWFERE